MNLLRPRLLGRAVLGATVASGCALLADIENIRYDAVLTTEAGSEAGVELPDADPTIDASSSDAGNASAPFCRTVTGVRFCSEFLDGSAEAEGWKTTQFPPSSRILFDPIDPPSPPFAAQAIHNGTSSSPASLDWTAPAANFPGGFVIDAKVWLDTDGPFLAVRVGSETGCNLTVDRLKVTMSATTTQTFAFSPTIGTKIWTPIRLEAAFVSATSSKITLRVGSETALIQSLDCAGVVDLRLVRLGVLAPKDAGNSTTVAFDDVTVANKN